MHLRPHKRRYKFYFIPNTIKIHLESIEEKLSYTIRNKSKKISHFGQFHCNGQVIYNNSIVLDHFLVALDKQVAFCVALYMIHFSTSEYQHLAKIFSAILNINHPNHIITINNYLNLNRYTN